MKKKSGKKEKGFVVVIAILTGSLLLAISIAILGIGIKELNLSSAGKDSQFAFYIANSGVECALFWDRKFPGLDNSPFMDPNKFSGNANITCNNFPITNWNPLPVIEVGSTATTTFFTIPFGDNCARVTVIKESNPKRTTLESRGQTKCFDLNAKGRVDRGIRARYSL